MRVEIDGVGYFPRADVEMMPSTFGEFLKRVRKSVSFSLDAASDAIGCSKSYLWEMENDRSEPSLRMASDISKTYGVELITLASYLNTPNAELKGGASAPSALSAVLGAVELIEETGMNKELNAAEAVYGFVGWLTTREERTVMSAKDDCAPIAELVKRFCTENNLPEVSDQWPSNLIHPSGEVAVPNAI